MNQLCDERDNQYVNEVTTKGLNNYPLRSIRTESQININNDDAVYTTTDNNLCLMHQLNKVRVQEHLR